MAAQMVSNLTEEVLSGVKDIRTAALFDFGLTAAVGGVGVFMGGDTTGNGANRKCATKSFGINIRVYLFLHFRPAVLHQLNIPAANV